MVPDPDWLKWYEGYDTSSDRQARLRLVREHIAWCLDACPPGPIRVISVCAGDGRDLVGLLPDHRRLGDVRAWLVEINQELVERGSAAIERASLAGRLAYLATDATLFSAYTSVTPADLVVAAGVFGNLRPTEVARFIQGLSSLCRPGGFVVWTRHRLYSLYNDGPSALARIRDLFRDADFEAVAEDLSSDAGYVIGTHRHAGVWTPTMKEHRWFEFGGVE
jgi:hypothetical protein